MLSAQLIIVSGKGGVGKTVVAAALGRVLAERGRRVLLLETDPRENLHHLFDAEPSGGRIVAVDRQLAIQNARARAILDDVVRDKLKVGALASRVLASPIYQHFADAAPGLKEMMLLGYAMQATEGRKAKADVVILDAPASGHGVSLLHAPALVASTITAGPLGTMAGRIAGLLADPQRCAVVLATLAEEMPVTETLETIAAVERGVDLVVANQVWPVGDQGSEVRGQEKHLWDVRRTMNERELARLRAAWHGSVAELPLVGEEFGPALLAVLTASLARQLGADTGTAPQKGQRRKAARA